MAVMSEEDTELEARLAEEDAFEPADSFVEHANVSDPSIYQISTTTGPAAGTRQPTYSSGTQITSSTGRLDRRFMSGSQRLADASATVSIAT
jgi:hypothetical protein